jgi:hypothetical protein
VAAKYVVAALAVLFLCLGGVRLSRSGGASQARTWLIVGVLFAAVSLWLFVGA